MRGTSSNVKGRYSARHVQKSDANWSSESVFGWAKEMAEHNRSPRIARDIGLIE